MKNKIYCIGLIAIIAVATFFRLYHITLISLWHDEAFSALLINYNWHEMFYRIGLDVHPPLYYVLLRFWADVLGHSLLSLRGFSAFFGVAAVVAAYGVVQEAFKNKALSLTAAFFLAIHPFQIQYVTEARMYTLGTFLILLAAYFLLRALRFEEAYYNGDATTKNKTIWNWLWFALATSACMYTHYYEFFSVFALALYALYAEIKMHGREIKKYAYALSSYVLVLILYIPWLKTFMYQFNQVQASYWITKPDKWSVPSILWAMLTGSEASTSDTLARTLLILGTLFVLFVLVMVAIKEKRKEKWLVILGLVVPFILALLMSLKQSIFLERYFLFAELFFTIALAVWIFSFKSKTVKVVLSCIVAATMFWYSYANAKSLDAAAHPGMSAASSFVNANAKPGDTIVVDSAFEFFNFTYYNHTGITALLYTGGNPISDMPHFSGTALLVPKEISPRLDDATTYKPGQTVWLVWTNAYGGYGDIDPNVPLSWKLGSSGEHSWSDVRPYSGTNIYVAEYIVH